MPQATSAKTVTYTFTESEITAYFSLMARRHAKRVDWPPPSAIYIPVVLGALLIAVRSGHADFGAILLAGTIAYLGGVFSLRHEIMRSRRLQLAAFSREPWYRAPRHVTLGDDAFEYSTPKISARFDYAAFVGVEVSHGLIIGWTGYVEGNVVGAATAVPIRAFASTDEADAFANDMRGRIVAAFHV
jgi:hypothetical protein